MQITAINKQAIKYILKCLLTQMFCKSLKVFHDLPKMISSGLA